MDGHGNVLIVGTFDSSNPAIIAGGDTNSLQQGGYLIKLNASGNLVWSQSIGTNAELSGVAADAIGNIYVTGHTNLSYVTNGMTQSAWLLTKYDSSGKVLWSMQSQGDAEDDGLKLALDASSNIYLNGIFSSSNFILGSITLTNDHARTNLYDWYFDQFIAKFDSSGHMLWAKPLYGADQTSTSQPQPDATGALIMTGTFSKPLEIDATIVTNSGQDDVFVAKVDPSGNLLWAKDAGVGNFGGKVYDSANWKGEICLGGPFLSTTVSFGDATLTNEPGGAIYLVELDTNANEFWTGLSFSPGAPETTTTNATGGIVFLDEAGNVYGAGSLYSGFVPFDPPFISFVVKGTWDGSFVWTESPPPCNVITGDAFGNVFVAGNWSQNWFGGIPHMTPANINEIFIMKYGGPQLSLQVTNNQAVISWTTNATGLNLESSPTLSARFWSPVTNQPTTVGTNFVVTNSLSNGAQFYRLRNF